MFRVYDCITEQHDLRLVLAAGLLCFLAAYTAYNLIARLDQSNPSARKWWFGGAAFATGCGIWATHFIAMLGFQPAVRIDYDTAATTLSIVVAIVMSGIGLAVATRPKASRPLLGGSILGAGIGAMHYIGVFAWLLKGEVAFNGRYVAASLLIGTLGGAVATRIGTRRFDLRHRLAGAAVLTLAICGMHFTGMSAVEITPDPTVVLDTDFIPQQALGIVVAAVSLLILALSLGAAILDERLASHAAREAAREAAALKVEIDERKAAQAELQRQRDILQRHRDNLEQEVGARTAALAASEARIVDAIETLPQAFVLFDAEDRLVVCNAGYRALSETMRLHAKPGIAYEELIRLAVQSGDHAIKDVDPERWVAERIALHRAVGDQTVRTEEQRPDGRWLKIYERRIRDGSLVSMQVDVTEMRGRLAMLAERDKMTALGQLAGGVAHEINNLLQPALIFPELVRENLPPEDVESREYLDAITDSVRKARDIVRNILLYVRNEKSGVQIADLGLEVGAGLKFIRGLLPPGISLEEQIGTAPWTAQFNKTELTQVLSNLVLNAAHAIGGQGTIAVNLAKTRPTAAQAKELGLEAGAVYATIKVADQGTGMDPATIARIFDPFFTTKPIGVGTGLGLSVVLGILKSWNGAVAVHSELGLGTTFTLFIPLMKEGGEADVMPARVQALQSVA